MTHTVRYNGWHCSPFNKSSRQITQISFRCLDPSEKCSKLFRHEAASGPFHPSFQYSQKKSPPSRTAGDTNEGTEQSSDTVLCTRHPGETRYWHGYLATIRKWHQPRKLCQFTRAGVNHQANSWADNSKLNLFTRSGFGKEMTLCWAENKVLHCNESRGDNLEFWSGSEEGWS